MQQQYLKGQMSDRPLLISQILQYAADYNSTAEIVSRTIEGPIHRYTYRDANKRAKQLAEALIELGIQPGDRVGTLAWNGYRHFELYYAISGIGSVTHTINPRLFEDQLVYIMNHAQDTALFIDLNLLPLVQKLKDKLTSIKYFVLMTDKEHMPQNCPFELLCYEELIQNKPGTLIWPEFDEKTASALCYTSGTTGNPKGVLYDHRATVLHAIMFTSSYVVGLSSDNSILPVVPMFHANAWCLVYAAPLAGSKLVFPGCRFDGASIYELLDTENVDISAGVPTVWLLLLNYCDQNNIKLSKMKTTLIGGSAVPRSMIEKFWNTHNVIVKQGWGMTELTPLGTLSIYNQQEKQLPIEKKIDIAVRQGRPVFGIEIKIIDDNEKNLPNDGKSSGNLVCRGPWVVKGYFNDPSPQSFTKDGWFYTGDVATIDETGIMTITDRTKDVIKSGGEWISTIDLENVAQGHPAVFMSAVIGLKHPKWDERPLLVIKKKENVELTKEEILQFLSLKVAKFWLPNDVQFVDDIPLTATGKIYKLKLREQFKDYQFPN